MMHRAGHGQAKRALRRWLASAGVALAAAATGSLARAEGPAWFPLEPGARLHYDLHRDRSAQRSGTPLERQFFHGRSFTEVLPASAGDAGRVRVLLHDVEREANLTGHATERREELLIYSADAAGVWLHGHERQGERRPYDPPLRFLSLPLREGRSWDVGTLHDGPLRVEARAEVVGLESLVIGGRTFSDVAHVRFEGPMAGRLDDANDARPIDEGHYRDDLWLARGVGPIRQVTAIEIRTRDEDGKPLRVSDLVTRTLADAPADEPAAPGR